MSKAVFITATDTNAGKTWITTHLIQALLKQGENAKALKPIACGFNAVGKNNDVQKLLEVQGLQQVSDINYYSFAKPAAPSIAAKAERKRIQPTLLQAFCQNEINNVDLCLIEAVGGLMVPLAPDYLVSDWLSSMPNIPIILVIGAKLGCINHTLLSLAHLSQISRKPTWVIINNTDGKQDLSTIKEAIHPYIRHDLNILECGYDKLNDLSPLISYLTELSTIKV